MNIDQIKAAFEVYRPGLAPEVQFLFDSLIALNEQLEKRIQTLENQLAKDSHNSSKPPSSDPPKAKRTKSLRTKSKNKPGGQPGHKGHKLELSARVDDFIVHRLSVCPDCGASLADQPLSEVIRKQLWDIPPINIHVVEHQVEVKTCGCCGNTWQAGGLPAHIRHEVEYGPGIKALGVYLQCHHHLPMERACQVMSDLFGLPISQGSLANFTQSAYERLSVFEQGLRSCILRSKSAFFDETGLRLLKKNHWMHTASTLKHALFQVHARRGGKALEHIGLLAQYEGVAHHDAYSSYFGFKRCRHSLCNAHSLRDLTFVEEQHKQSWAGELKSLLCRIKSSADASDSGCVDIRWQGRFRKEYRQLLSQGLDANPLPEKIPGKKGKMAKTFPRNLLERLQKRENDYLRFMYDPDAFFDNNQAERDLRMNKVKMKISGCFRSFEAAKAFARIRSFLLTAQKQSVNVLEALKDVFSPQPVFYLNLIT
jgi:transposase